MRVLWSWLSELWEPGKQVTPEEGAAALTRVGLEVEAVEKLGDDFSGVVVGEVASKRPHPEADRLTLVMVSDGSGGTTEVVCGASNVPAPGGRVLWARPGARLPGGLEIGKRKLKGVESAGMLCSEKELGLSEEGEGIAVLADLGVDARPGTVAQDALHLRDAVFEVSVPANRPDCLGHIGLARELCAALGLKLRLPVVELAAVTDPKQSAEARVKVAIADSQGCPRYTARIIDGLTVGKSPFWLRRSLQAVGVRSINNLVDATNFVMFELGHPLHAFDFDKVRGGRIEVRRARAGEKMTTLDKIERELFGEDLLICDAQGPVALAGVMGGLESEVSATTKRVLLEAATFQPLAVRRTARRMALPSESSQRFERGVDAAGLELASQRAAHLIAELGGGKVANGWVDVYPAKAQARSVRLRLTRTRQLTGVDITREQARDVLERLSVPTAPDGKNDDVLVATCPTFRPDLTREVDLIEDVLRHYGYERVPATLPQRTQRPHQFPDARPRAVREALVAYGMCEAVTFAFCAADRIARLRLPAGDRRATPLPVRNPMTIDQAVMRTSLLPNLLAALAHNLKYDVSDVSIFEIGSVFWPHAGQTLPEEPVRAAGVLSGRRPGWLTPGDPVDFFDARAAVVAALAALLGPRASDVRLVAARDIPYFHPGVCARIELDGAVLGELGEVHPEVRAAFDIGPTCFAFDLDLVRFPAPAPRVMQPIPRYPAVVRDVSFFVSDAVPAARVSELVEAAQQPLISEVRCLEDYRDPERVPAGKKGMLWSITYRSQERTLTDAEVDSAHEAIVAQLLAELDATRR